MISNSSFSPTVVKIIKEAVTNQRTGSLDLFALHVPHAIMWLFKSGNIPSSVRSLKNSPQSGKKSQKRFRVELRRSELSCYASSNRDCDFYQTYCLFAPFCSSLYYILYIFPKWSIVVQIPIKWHYYIWCGVLLLLFREQAGFKGNLKEILYLNAEDSTSSIIGLSKSYLVSGSRMIPIVSGI